MKKTFKFNTRLGSVVISGELIDGIYDDIQFVASPEFHALPDSAYLEELITYAVLEGYPEPEYSFSLDSEEGYTPSWTWSDDTCGEVIDTFIFNANGGK